MTAASLPYKVPKRRGRVMSFIVGQPLGSAGGLFRDDNFSGSHSTFPSFERLQILDQYL